MKFSEAMRALEDGKKVWHRAWRVVPRGYIHRVHDKIVDEKGNQYSTLGQGIDLSANWEIYEEPGRDWAWALEQLKHGRRVREKIWGESESIGPNNPVYVGYLFATDWELYHE